MSEMKPHSLVAFADDMQRLINNLVRYYAVCDRVCVEELRITASQGYILMALPEAGSVTMNELSEKMRLANSTMTRMADQLVQKGMVRREPDTNDRRVVRVRLTEQGQDVRTRFKEALVNLFSQVLEDIPEGEKENILHDLETLNQSILNTLKSCCGTDLGE
jgi:DNA-binding MarR family transcriptional regulator